MLSIVIGADLCFQQVLGGSMASQSSAAARDVKLKQIEAQIGPDELLELAATADEMLAQVRESMLKPYPRKIPPQFSTTQLASLCNIDRQRLNYLVGKGELPPGTLQGSGRARAFTLRETRQWIQAEAKIPKRPSGQRGKIIVVSNFKGGSTKTSTAMTLAQGLTLCGLLPDAEIQEEMTVMPLIYGEHDNLAYAVQPTYWDGMDLIPGAPGLFAAEFAIPHAVAKEPGFHFWEILTPSLQALAEDYDAIVIDTPPSLSYLTINALMAADGMLMPLPPNALDFASAAQYWNLFSDLTASFQKRQFEKRFDFMHVLLSKVNAQDPSSAVVRDWIMTTYAGKVLPVEIPLTSVTSATATEFATVYDVSKWEGSSKTYSRARDAYDRLVELIDAKIVNLWYQQPHLVEA